MVYDLDDRLTEINASGTADDATFTLDALGRFRTRVTAAGTDTYSYLDTSETVTRIAYARASAVSASTSAVANSSTRALYAMPELVVRLKLLAHPDPPAYCHHILLGTVEPHARVAGRTQSRARGSVRPRRRWRRPAARPASSGSPPPAAANRTSPPARRP
jgi:hypothetical protein